MTNKIKEALAADQAFIKWMARVDKICQSRVFISIHDLPDKCFRDYFDDGVSPSEVVEEILEEEGWLDCME